MIFPSRRKRPTTARGPSIRRRLAASALALGLLGAGGTALGQQPRLVAQTPARAAESPAPPLAGPAPTVERIRPVAAQEPATGPTIQLTVMQAGAADMRGTERTTFDLLVEPPGPLRIFSQFDTEAKFKERVRQEGRERTPPEPIEFPDVPVISKEQYTPGRTWEPLCHLVEPNYVCYKKLLFEEKNSERYGWDLGILQPAVSAGAFFADMFFLPYHCATAPGRPECSAGYRLPGDPIPYLLYPPELSVTGLWAQSASMLIGYKYFPDQQATPPPLRISGTPTESGGGGATGLPLFNP